MVRLFCALYRLQIIHTGEIGADQCALGIFDNGERKTGYIISLYASSRIQKLVAARVTAETAMLPSASRYDCLS